jgi:para-nitrobenzyl esterase
MRIRTASRLMPKHHQFFSAARLGACSALLLLCQSSLAIAAPVGTDVTTDKGGVEGFKKSGILEFLGIPYAAPPVGNLRWRPPLQHAEWQTRRSAKAFGPTCAQVTELGLFAGPTNSNEDCLYLNVFTPAVSTTEKLPVVFWIHGGGNVDGESNDYDGSKMANLGHVVVVTINYRLNLFGFLAHPALDNEGHLFGNYGILDQQLAMRWVRRNIAAFGGDPRNITVGGQSAGASDTGLNLISPLAAGLFDQAIIESGAAYLAVAPLAAAEAKATAFSTAAGCGAGTDHGTAACLRQLPAATILALSGTPSANGPYIAGTMIDGQIVPSGAASAFAAGNFTHMPIMNGSVEDEGDFFIAIQEYFSGPPRQAITQADVENYVSGIFGGNAGPGGTPPAYPQGTVQQVLRKYAEDAYTTPQLRLDAIETDVMVCRTQHADHLLVGQVPLYAYEFQDRTAPFYFPRMPGFVPLAYHTSDIQYLFPLWHGGDEGTPHKLRGKQAILSDELVTAWTNFAWTGNPNGHGQTPWPEYKSNKSAASFLAENIPALTTFSDQSFTAEHKCGFWNDLLLYN